jgi:hypothetical protein
MSSIFLVLFLVLVLSVFKYEIAAAQERRAENEARKI